MVRYRWYHAEQKSDLYALVDPISPPSEAVDHWLGQQTAVSGGGAGYRPRVRMVYYIVSLSP